MPHSWWSSVKVTQRMQSSNLSKKDLVIDAALLWWIFFRGGHPDVFCEKGVYENLASVTGKHIGIELV